MSDAAAALRVGVLALQGDFDAHAKALRRAAEGLGLGADVLEIRRASQLPELHGLVLPGGESTTLLKLMERDDLGRAIGRWVAEQGGSLFGTCAGAILISCEVLEPSQPSLGLLDATVERNAYGRQVDSFVARLSPEPGSGLGPEPLEAVFIRAPRFVRLSPKVQVLLRHGADPVLVRQGRVLAATFHPEMTADPRVHATWLRGIATGAK